MLIPHISFHFTQLCIHSFHPILCLCHLTYVHSNQQCVHPTLNYVHSKLLFIHYCVHWICIVLASSFHLFTPPLLCSPHPLFCLLYLSLCSFHPELCIFQTSLILFCILSPFILIILPWIVPIPPCILFNILYFVRSSCQMEKCVLGFAWTVEITCNMSVLLLLE